MTKQGDVQTGEDRGVQRQSGETSEVLVSWGSWKMWKVPALVTPDSTVGGTPDLQETHTELFL